MQILRVRNANLKREPRGGICLRRGFPIRIPNNECLGGETLLEGFQSRIMNLDLAGRIRKMKNEPDLAGRIRIPKNECLVGKTLLEGFESRKMNV